MDSSDSTVILEVGPVPASQVQSLLDMRTAHQLSDALLDTALDMDRRVGVSRDDIVRLFRDAAEMIETQHQLVVLVSRDARTEREIFDSAAAIVETLVEQMEKIVDHVRTRNLGLMAENAALQADLTSARAAKHRRGQRTP